jgi:hypothetical protein
METIRTSPCSACPYRCDVPPGVWSFDDYERLRPYDAPTWAQPPLRFSCHATPAALCHGWAVVHSRRGHDHELLALRLVWPEDGIPVEVVPLFTSGAEAADHGQSAIAEPPPEAIRVMDRLLAKHPRLRRH